MRVRWVEEEGEDSSVDVKSRRCEAGALEPRMYCANPEVRTALITRGAFFDSISN